MDNVSKDTAKPAPQQSDVDWYGFNQSTKPGSDKAPTTPASPSDDPYSYHQNGPAKPGQTPGGRPPTLYDAAVQDMQARNVQIKSQDDIYRHLNEMMVAHGHRKANIDGRNHINDHMLPRSWNNVDPASILDGAAPKPKPEQPKPEAPRPPQPHPVEQPRQTHPVEQPRQTTQPQAVPRVGYEQPQAYYPQQTRQYYEQPQQYYPQQTQQYYDQRYYPQQTQQYYDQRYYPQQSRQYYDQRNCYPQGGCYPSGAEIGGRILGTVIGTIATEAIFGGNHRNYNPYNRYNNYNNYNNYNRNSQWHDHRGRR
jgi:hypothetical protein